MSLYLAQEWLKLETSMGGRPKLTGSNIEEIRENAANMAPPPVGANSTDSLEIYDTMVLGTHIPVRIYVPKKNRNSNFVSLFFHGGGWCTGDIDGEDALVQYMAVETSIPFVSAGYRLAPEHPWPASLEDCVATAEWAVDILSRTIDTRNSPPNLLLTGTSAGGQLAFATAAKLLESGRHVHGIVSLAPLTITKEAVPPRLRPRYTSMFENAEAPIVSPESLQIFLDANGHDPEDRLFNVLLSTRIAEFPPTYLVTCGADILRDDGMLMVEELHAKGVAVKHDNYDGYPHVFWGVPGLDVNNQFRSNLTEGIRFILCSLGGKN